MSESKRAAPGTIGWVDLSVPDALRVRDFYAAVVGWEPSAVPMGDYEDWCMSPPGAAAPVAGVCHARGPNAELPPAWIVYVTVEDLDASLARCEELGGMRISEIRGSPEHGRFALIRDPAGAALALHQAPAH